MTENPYMSMGLGNNIQLILTFKSKTLLNQAY
jgi:hypothetical protein